MRGSDGEPPTSHVSATISEKIGLTPEVGGLSSRPSHGLTTVVIHVTADSTFDRPSSQDRATSRGAFPVSRAKRATAFPPAAFGDRLPASVRLSDKPSGAPSRPSVIGLSARILIGPALKRVCYVTAGRSAGASGLFEPRVPQKVQPMGMRLTGQQLRGTLVDSTGDRTSCLNF